MVGLLSLTTRMDSTALLDIRSILRSIEMGLLCRSMRMGVVELDTIGRSLRMEQRSRHRG
jgi:hypothetical protein